ncbi:MAG: hypothetical protein KY475_16220 [Planctomycetes bacterium]|nr:hypothetical protein [Planctomycetota bacterium]
MLIGLREANAQSDAPKSLDERVTIDLFAEHPLIVTPTGIAVDGRGRVFAAESHTHFRPDDYDGPHTDRIVIVEDSDGDGRADRRRVFHEGFTHLMDLEFHPDGSLYAATRMDIHRLRDTDADDAADEITPIIRMDTTGTYPHNGLSGLAFDFRGDLHFGLGENLGHAYTLIGTDGVRLSGGGEGGSTYHVRPDGTRLRRVSTGWWNPFGMCVDAFGRVFGTDNDPGASPPCRLIQVVDGGDYGYEYRYGRTGLHPLVSWTGDAPGVLPMIAGTGEAPCEILAYEAAALPEAYRGCLLVASWADHRIEYYPVEQTPNRGLTTTSRKTLIESAGEFRPVGLATAPDGSVYVSDWVSSSYELHKQGRIWRIRPKNPRIASSPNVSITGWEAMRLTETEEARVTLRDWAFSHHRARLRATAVQALAAVNDAATDFANIARGDAVIAIRALALRHHLGRGGDPAPWCNEATPAAVRAEAVRRLDPQQHRPLLLAAAESDDPLLFHAAVQAWSQHPPAAEEFAGLASRQRQAALLAIKRSSARDEFAASQLGRMLEMDDPAVRYIAVKWIADDRRVEHQDELRQLLRDRTLDYRLFLAATAALDVLEGKPPADRPAPSLLLEQIADDGATVTIRKLSLRLIDPSFQGLTIEHFADLLDHPDADLRVEAVRTLAQHPGEGRSEVLAEVARDERQSTDVRAWAIAGLAPEAEQYREVLIDLAQHARTELRDEALRALVGVALSSEEARLLLSKAAKHEGAAEAVRRITEGSPGERPTNSDCDAWESLLNGAGDASAGERIFFGAKVGTCSRCHEVDGRGTAVGPDLSQMERRLAARGDDGRRWLLKTILEPSKEMAPQYTPWTIITTDGKTLTGLPRRRGGGVEAYLGLDGEEFTVRKSEIELHRESRVSIMPENLLGALTQGELNDLFAFLQQNR